MAVAPTVSYLVHKTRKQPGIGGKWNSPDRVHAEELTIGAFYGDMDHKPVAKLKMLYDDRDLYGVFMVEDRYVSSQETEYQSDVTRDACVAAYIQAKRDRGYLALEMNCCGTLRAHFIEEPDDGHENSPHKIIALPWKQGHQIRIYTSQFGVVSPEITEPMIWYLEFVVPFSLFEQYVGPVKIEQDTPWYANFYKCSSRCSSPHRASWAPLNEGISFHQPDSFAPVYFV